MSQINSDPRREMIREAIRRSRQTSPTLGTYTPEPGSLVGPPHIDPSRLEPRGQGQMAQQQYAQRGIDLTPNEAMAAAAARSAESAQPDFFDIGAAPTTAAGRTLSPKEAEVVRRLRARDAQGAAAATKESADAAGWLGRTGASVQTSGASALSQSMDTWDRLMRAGGIDTRGPAGSPTPTDIGNQMFGVAPETEQIASQAGLTSRAVGSLAALPISMTDPIAMASMAASRAVTPNLMAAPEIKAALALLEKRAGKAVSNTVERIMSESDAMGLFEGLDAALRYDWTTGDPQQGFQAITDSIVEGAAQGTLLGAGGSAIHAPGEISADRKAATDAANKAKIDAGRKAWADAQAARSRGQRQGLYLEPQIGGQPTAPIQQTAQPTPPAIDGNPAPLTPAASQPQTPAQGTPPTPAAQQTPATPTQPQPQSVWTNQQTGQAAVIERTEPGFVTVKRPDGGTDTWQTALFLKDHRQEAPDATELPEAEVQPVPGRRDQAAPVPDGAAAARGRADGVPATEEEVSAPPAQQAVQGQAAPAGQGVLSGSPQPNAPAPSDKAAPQPNPAGKSRVRKGTQLTRAQIEQTLLERNAAMRGGFTEEDADEAAGRIGTGGGQRTFYNFKAPPIGTPLSPQKLWAMLPTEIRERFTPKEAAAAKFQVTSEPGRAGGEDYASDIGWSTYESRIKNEGAGEIESAKATFRNNPNDPEAAFYAALHDALPPGSDAKGIKLIDAKTLKAGDEFTVNGIPVRVEDEGGESSYLVLKDGPDLPETPVDAMGKIPVDGGKIVEAEQSDPDADFAAGLDTPAPAPTSQPGGPKNAAEAKAKGQAKAKPPAEPPALAAAKRLPDGTFVDKDAQARMQHGEDGDPRPTTGPDRIKYVSSAPLTNVPKPTKADAAKERAQAKATAPKTRDELVAEIRAAFGGKGVSDEQVDAWVALADARAKAKGETPEMWWRRNIAGATTDAAPDGALAQDDSAQNAPIWHSKLRQTVEQKMGGAMDAQQLRKMLENAGVKPEELEWSRLDRLRGKLTKQQVLEHLDEHAVRVEETVKGQPYKTKEPRVVKRNDTMWEVKPGLPDSVLSGRGITAIIVDRGEGEGEYRFRVNFLANTYFFETLDRAMTDAKARAERAGKSLAEARSESPTKFGTYTMPGGKDYRELLLTLPSDNINARVERFAKAKGINDIGEAYRRYHAERSTLPPGYKIVEQAKRGSDEMEYFLQKPDGSGYGLFAENMQAATDRAWSILSQEGAIKDASRDDFTRSHWDEPNVLAHVRFNDRTDAQGRRVLFIEEIQSDWHQKGRKEGYADPERRKYIENKLAENQPLTDQEEADRLEMLKDRAVPDAPFKKTWPTLAMKRMIRWAAENGYDRIAWAPGQIQNDRYSLEKHIRTLHVEKIKGGRIDGHYAITAIDHNGRTVLDDAYPAGDLPDVIGDEMTKKILDSFEGDAPAAADPKMVEAYAKVVEAAKKFLEAEQEVHGDRMLKIKPDLANNRWEVARVDSGAVQYRYTSEDEAIVGMASMTYGARTAFEAAHPTVERAYKAFMKVYRDNWSDYEDAGHFPPNHPESQHKRNLKRTFGGLDLRTGGEGMRGFYDQILPKETNALIKKWGAKVDLGDVVTDADAGDTMASSGFDITPTMRADALERGLPLFQGKRAAVAFGADGKAMLHALESPNASSGAHELGHIFRRDLTAAERAPVEAHYGIEDGIWTTAHEERYARDFERYLAKGEAPTPELKTVFEKFKKWMADIYKAITGTPLEEKLSETMRQHFQAILGGDPKALAALRAERATPKVAAADPATPNVATETTGEDLGMKKAEHDRIRKELGLDELPEPDRRKWKGVLDDAKSRGLDKTALERVRSARQTGRPMTDAEHAGVVIRAAEVANEYDQAMRESADLINAGDVPGAATVRARVDQLRDELDELTQADRLVGRETARALAIRRMMVNRESFQIADVVQRATEIKGSRLTDEERAKLEFLAKNTIDLQAKLEAAEKKAQKYREERDKAMAGQLIRRHAEKKAAKDKIEHRRQKLKNERNDIKLQLQRLGMRTNEVVGATTEGTALIARLAVNYIRDGALTLEEVVKSVRGDLPDLTDADIIRAMAARSPKGEARARSQAERTIAAIKEQAKLMTAIADAEAGIFEQKQKAGAAVPAEIARLRGKLKALKATARKAITDADRLQNALRTIDELDDLLQKGARPIKGKPKPADPPALAAAKSQQAEIRRQMRQQDKAAQITADVQAGKLPTPQARPKPTEIPELKQAREKMRELQKITRMTEQLADLEQQLQTGNLTVPTAPAKSPLAPEVERLQLQLRKAKRDVRIAIDDLRPMTPGRVLRDSMNFLRTVKATADISATLRQGLVLTARDPLSAAKALPKSIWAAASPDKADQIDNALRNDPRQYLRDKAGLYLSDLDGNRTKREEQFMSEVARRIPVLNKISAASERHMTTHLNLLRVSAFDSFLDAHPNATAEELKAWANVVNVISGRGNLNLGTTGGNIASLFFFAPRFAYSRVEAPTLIFHHWKEPRVRKEIAKTMAKTVGAGMAILGLAALAGLEVGLDPDEPDWGKIRISDTRIDIWGGFQQPARIVAKALGATYRGIARAISGGDKAAAEKQIRDFKIAGNNPAAQAARAAWNRSNPNDKIVADDPDPLGDIGHFMKYKMAPGITVPYELWRGKDLVGTETSRLETAVKAFVPLIWADVYDAAQEGGTGAAVLTGAAAFIGLGASTYADSKGATRRKIAAAETSGDYTNARNLRDAWNKANPEDRIGRD